MTRQAHKAQTGRHGPRKDHGGPVDQRTAQTGRHGPRKRPPRPRTDTSHGPTASTADGHQRHGPPASTPASHTDGRHHGGRPTASASTGGHQYNKPHRHRHGRRPTRADHWRPVQTNFGEYGVSLAYTQVLVSGKATNIPASRAEVGEVIAAEVGPRSRGASSFEFVRREHCPRST